MINIYNRCKTKKKQKTKKQQQQQQVVDNLMCKRFVICYHKETGRCVVTATNYTAGTYTVYHGRASLTGVSITTAMPSGLIKEKEKGNAHAQKWG